MWILNFHIAFSILCMLTFGGFRTVFKEQIIKNGYKSKGKKKPFIFIMWIFFIPFLNVFTLIALFLMITKTKEEIDELSSSGQ